MKRIPVTYSFNHNKIVGILEIEDDWQPPTPDFCFGIGYRINKVDDDGTIRDFEVVEISIIDDHGYKKFLDDKYNDKV